MLLLISLLIIIQLLFLITDRCYSFFLIILKKRKFRHDVEKMIDNTPVRNRCFFLGTFSSFIVRGQCQAHRYATLNIALPRESVIHSVTFSASVPEIRGANYSVPRARARALCNAAVDGTETPVRTTSYVRESDARAIST